jgi:hypothetical protein
VRSRLSRIYWNGRFLDYPLHPADVIRKLGPVELTRALASYAAATAANHSFYALLARRLGIRGAIAGFLLHGAHYLAAAASVPVGVVIHMRRI